jgi:hypothetical protein
LITLMIFVEVQVEYIYNQFHIEEWSRLNVSGHINKYGCFHFSYLGL